MAIKQKRSKAVRVLMTVTTHDRLMALSEAMGQPPATLASIALSEYVAKHGATVKATETAIESMIEAIKPGFLQMMEREGT